MRARPPATGHSLHRADMRLRRWPLRPPYPPPTSSLPPNLRLRRCAWLRGPHRRLPPLQHNGRKYGRNNGRKYAQASPCSQLLPRTRFRKTDLHRNRQHRSQRAGPKCVRRLSVPFRKTGRRRCLPRVRRQRSVPYRNSARRRKLALRPHRSVRHPKCVRLLHRGQRLPRVRHRKSDRHRAAAAASARSASGA